MSKLFPLICQFWLGFLRFSWTFSRISWIFRVDVNRRNVLGILMGKISDFSNPRKIRVFSGKTKRGEELQAKKILRQILKRVFRPKVSAKVWSMGFSMGTAGASFLFLSLLLLALEPSSSTTQLTGSQVNRYDQTIID